ncbi:FxSxx-COOH system tetratricopeptide repeat protein [Dictyobacter formicarum]|uniref:Tetratricopeptide repeat protein n=1 Tax=Dictyobacter formicarum TaxID=2778368 RepID=A0ABQ3V9J2_9CHLR|nr:FxSxx-COOH system tetratricopeptide repeat protein [Dictyobacter formicarum]GHO82455.1 tetratricopeptide repeat protein [Dictyobacter formicarum]
MNNKSLSFSSFGETLKATRKRKRLTQKQLAQRIGVHYNTISSWELGTYLPDTRGLVLELARHLDMDELETRQLLEASLTALSPYWSIPYQRNPFFTGRDCILRQIYDSLHTDQTTSGQSCTISGLGGIGKTQTVIEYAYRNANEYSAIFWIGSQTFESIVSCFVTIADVLNLPARQQQEQNRIVEAVIRWLNSHNQWLLIFDNVEDIALIKNFLPAARHGSLLFTSRRQAFSITAQVLDLKPMAQEEGIQFLLRRSRLSELTTPQKCLEPGDEEIVRKIVQDMDGFPLALDQVGSYIEATHCSLYDYLRLYQSSQIHLLDERDAYDDHPMSVTRTFTLVFEQLRESSAPATEMLTVCAFLAPEAIPEMFFREGARYLGSTIEAISTDPFAFESTIKVLLTYSLLQRNAHTQTLMIHRLVQTVLKGHLIKATQQMWAARIINTMNNLFPSEEMTQANYWQDCERLLPHALVCITLSEQYNSDHIVRITLMNHVATYLVNRAHYAEAEPLLRRALDYGEQALGTKHFTIAETLYKLGLLYLQQGKHEQAEPLLQRSLSIREQVLGTEHPQVAISLNGLGTLHLRQGKYERAESFYIRALNIQKQALGAEHPQLATTLNELAIVYGEQEKYEQAESLYMRALNIREQALGTEHPQVATLLNNMARDYKERGEPDRAELLFQRALHIWEQHLGEEHPRVAYPLNNLAELYRERGEFEQAELLFQRALHIWEQRLGPEHFLVADPLDGLGILYREQGKFEKARLFFQRALHIRKQTFGPRHPSVADSLCHLARFYQMQKQIKEASSLYKQALATYKRTLGPEHLKTKTTHSVYLQLSCQQSSAPLSQ